MFTLRLRSGVLAVVVVATAACQASTESLDEATLAVVERTRKPTANYSAYSWNWLTVPGKAPREEWSAEFHNGSRHRVETPGVRLVADCAVGTGVGTGLEDGVTTRGQAVANAACGINSNKDLEKAEHLGQLQTSFGPADRVRL